MVFSSVRIILDALVGVEVLDLFWGADWWELELFEDSSPSLKVWYLFLTLLLCPAEWRSETAELVSVREYPLGKSVARKTFC